MNVDEDLDSNEWVERVKEYFITCVHTVLFARGVYPHYIFEQRRYLGISIWFSRHPEVNEYIQKVINNAHPMIMNNLIDRMVVAFDSKDNTPLDHIIVKCASLRRAFSNSEELSDGDRTILEEEFRSTVLRLGMLDQQMTRVPEDATWKIMMITTAPDSTEERQVMQTQLLNGQWYVDNNKLPEQVSIAHRAQGGSLPRLLPIKAFRDQNFNMTTYANIFSTSQAIHSSQGTFGNQGELNATRDVSAFQASIDDDSQG